MVNSNNDSPTTNDINPNMKSSKYSSSVIQENVISSMHESSNRIDANNSGYSPNSLIHKDSKALNLGINFLMDDDITVI